MNTAQILKKKLKELREQKNLSQFDLGIRVGCYPQAISQIESSEHLPNLKTLIKIVEALDARIEIIPNERSAA